MEQILTIKPSRESNILKSIKANVIYETQGDDGKIRTNNLGAPKSLVIPGTSGNKRISWNDEKRSFYLGEDLTDEDLNILVAACKFKNDMVGHPDKGRIIVTADRRDRFDPFFNHRMAQVLLEEATGSLNSSTPFEKIFIYYAKNSPKDFINNELGDQNVSSLSAKYVLIDSNNVATHKQKIRRDSQEASRLLENLDDSKKRKISMYLGVSEKTDLSLVEDFLWDICVNPNKEEQRKLFIQLCTLSTEKLAMRELIALAKQHGFLKIKSGRWILQGVEIGKNDKEVDAYFDDLNNSDVIEALEKKIATRKK